MKEGVNFKCIWDTFDSGNRAYLMRVIFHVVLLSADFFSKLVFSKNSFRNTIRVSNILDPDQA